MEHSWLVSIYATLVRQLKTRRLDSPFTSIRSFCAGLSLPDLNLLELVMIDKLSPRDLKAIERAEHVARAPQRNRTSAQFLVGVYVIFVRTCRNWTFQSPFHSIGAFYAGLGLTSEELAQANRLLYALPARDANVVEAVEKVPLAAHRKREVGARILQGDINTLELLLGTLSRKTVDAMRASNDPIAYVKDHILTKYPEKRNRLVGLGLF
jgi:hypothetical protein